MELFLMSDTSDRRTELTEFQRRGRWGKSVATTKDLEEATRTMRSKSTTSLAFSIAIALFFAGCPLKHEHSKFVVMGFTHVSLVKRSMIGFSGLHNSASETSEFFENSPSAAAPVLPRRRPRNSKKKGKRTGQSAAATPISAQELAAHVASSYVNGRGGVYHQTMARRRRQAEESAAYGTDAAHQEQAAYLRKLDRHPALVLNADYQPLSVLPLSLWSWQDTIKAVFMGKVTVVETYKDVLIRAVTLDMPLPSVIALNEYVPKMHRRPAFTRRNVFLRDGYQCQYCSNYFRAPELSIDHVVPRCRGGKLEWENAVTCCRRCNGRKGSRIPHELKAIGMKLTREPRCPSQYELSVEAGKMMPRKVHPTWSTYLGFHHEKNSGEDDSQTPSFVGQEEEVESGIIY